MNISNEILVTNHPDIDKLTNSLYFSNLIIIAGSTNDDEMLLALKITQNIANKQTLSAAIFSGERTNEYILTFLKRVKKSPEFLCHPRHKTIQGLHKEIKNLKIEHEDLSLILIDDLQDLVSDSYYDQRTFDVLKTLKDLSQELNAMIIACVPIKREIETPESNIEKRQHKELFQSEADCVLSLSCDNYYEHEFENKWI